MSEAMPEPESNEDSLKRLEAERVALLQTCIDQLWNADHGSPEDATKAREFFEECLTATRELIDHEVQPDFDKEKDLEGARRFYLHIIDTYGNEFIRKRNLKMNIAQMRIVCEYYYNDKILARRIQASIDNIHGLRRMQQKG